MAQTVREKVLEVQVEVRDSATLQPERAAEILLELTSLLGVVNDEIRKPDVAYNLKLKPIIRASGRFRCYNSPLPNTRYTLPRKAQEEARC